MTPAWMTPEFWVLVARFSAVILVLLFTAFALGRWLGRDPKPKKRAPLCAACGKPCSRLADHPGCIEEMFR